MGGAQPRSHRGSRRRFGRPAALATAAVLAVPFLSGCSFSEAIRFGWSEGVTPQAENMRTLWTWSAIAALAVGVFTWGAMFWAMIFHRKGKRPADAVPRQTQYNGALEVTFTVIPAIIVAVLFGFTVVVQNDVERHDPNPDLTVDVTAFQWNWNFGYPGHNGADGQPVSTLGTSDTIPLLVLPTGKRIQFVQHSNDVIHSFYIPEFLFKRDVFPDPAVNDQDNVWQIDSIDREGAFVGRCAELCGSYHSQMNFEVRALPSQQFDQWLALRAQTDPKTGAPYTAGEALAQMNCGQLCTPTAYTTYPFNSDRTARTASEPVASPAGN